MGNGGMALLIFLGFALIAGVALAGSSSFGWWRNSAGGRGRAGGLPHRSGNAHPLLVALLFFVFEVAIVLMLLWALVLREGVEAGRGPALFAQMGIFFGLLALALVVACGRGVLRGSGREGEGGNT